jgi:hypothetical protein
MSRLDDLMQTKMTRRHFLRTLGVSVVALLGLPAILRVLDYQGSSTSNQPIAEDSYGISPYGGKIAPSNPHTFG